MLVGVCKRITVLSGVVHLVSGAIFTDPSFVYSNKYDYIVAGAGTAGCVIASRLTEDPAIKVLVIEAGLFDNGPDSNIIHTPILAGQGVGTEYDWKYVTTNQIGLNNQSIAYPRGFVVGGSSALNSMVYARGPSEDFDRLASVSQDNRWTWDSLQPFIFRNERHVPDWSNRNVEGEYNPAVHGTGPLMTSLTANKTRLDHRVFEAVDELGDKFFYNEDLNSGYTLGFGWLRSTIGNGARSDSSSAFLTPALNIRANIDLLLQTHVVKVTDMENRNDFRTVQLSQSDEGLIYNITALKEVILSAGSIGTPQILMLSGIGDVEHLSSLGLTGKVNLPNVGRNMQDQAVLGIQYLVNDSSLQDVMTNNTLLQTALTDWGATQTGFAASNVLINTQGFLRLDSDAPPLSLYPDPSAGENSPHISFAFEDFFVPNPNQSAPNSGHWITASVVVQSPTSRGSISLLSTSSFDHPAIDPAFLTTDFDLQATIQAVHTLQKFFNASAFENYIISPHPDAANLTDDADIETYARLWSNTLHHPVATAKMSASDNDGVVRSDLCVHGTTGLRVVDASILPYAPGGFPQAQVYIVAERGSVFIQESGCGL
ncbi:aryl-alcohol oxidase-like protein [Lentinula aff. lateritia]|uniref:Aryl-alcohol oxidase-like protein n=1 Tax=Lentinula aff. lateritia TaxID=2804960 RepID=A0ACC1TSX5_9AGAR|nr:aryl-alcohol oxidase-like protein [Lentinula aff. lateritia]